MTGKRGWRIKSVLRGLCYDIDDEHIRGRARGLQFQAQYLMDGGEQPRRGAGRNEIRAAITDAVRMGHPSTRRCIRSMICIGRTRALLFAMKSRVP